MQEKYEAFLEIEKGQKVLEEVAQMFNMSSRHVMDEYETAKCFSAMGDLGQV